MSGSTKDILLGGMAAVSAGKAVDSNSIGGVAAEGNSEVGVSYGSDEEHVTSGESVETDSLPGAGEDSQEDSQSAEPASSQAKTEASSKEAITISDEKGRRKVEVDFGNKDQLKKYVQMAYGARKWQAERDQARQESVGLKTKVGELQSNWDALETAFRERGEEGVIDLLAGQQGAYKSHIQKQIEQQNWLKRASPEEIEAFEAKQAHADSQREIARIRKENEEFRKQMTEERETANLRSLESRVNPVFDKYRFADKLGDANDEQMFDEMLWNTALKRLEPYEEKGVEITPELVDKQFRDVAMSLRKRIGQQAERKASQVVEQKKKEATENVQAKVVSGYKTGSTAKEAGELIKNGNLSALLKNWGKYGSTFNGGKK